MIICECTNGCAKTIYTEEETDKLLSSTTRKDSISRIDSLGNGILLYTKNEITIRVFILNFSTGL